MKQAFFKLFLVLIFLLMVQEGFSQKATRLVVIDSISFEALPAVFVRVKNSNRSYLADASGTLTLPTYPTDTLSITHIGYHEAVVPLFFEEDAILIRMSPKVILLEEVVFKSRKLYPNELNPRVSAVPRTKRLEESIMQPWEYFNKREKEKRKLVKLMQENDQIKTFMEVIMDPSVKEELMENYALEEERYYDILVKFNQQKLPVIYSNDSERIIEALHAFFERETQ